jgi:hypothetical protein
VSLQKFLTILFLNPSKFMAGWTNNRAKSQSMDPMVDYGQPDSPADFHLFPPAGHSQQQQQPMAASSPAQQQQQPMMAFLGHQQQQQSPAALLVCSLDYIMLINVNF